MNEDILKKLSNDSDWRGRISALNSIKDNSDKRIEKAVVKLALNDPVFKVKNKAFLLAQKWGVKIGKNPIRLTKSKKGNLVKGIHQKLASVRDSFSDEFTLEEFKVKFKEMYPKAYDIYDGEKGNKLDKFLENSIKCLPKKK